MRTSILSKSRFFKSIAFTVATAISLQGFAQMPSQPTTIEKLAAGPPHLEKNLGSETFVPFEVHRLANPLLAYIDYEWFRERGVDIPKDGIRNPRLQQDALNAFAWMSKTGNDPESEFTKVTRKLYAYYYGGYGLAGNVGSGRSAAFAEFDVKGLKTTLAKSNNSHHSNGAAITIEAMDEAIWGRILEAETIFGSNRIVAVIFTNTFVPDPAHSGRVLPRALIVREMGIRPAHHMQNRAREMNDDLERLKVANRSLLANLPYPEGYKPTSGAEAMRTGLLELAKREGKTQARMFARRIYFGSNSPSNLELKNRRLDLGDHTTQEGFSKIIRISDESPFGEIEEFKSILEAIRGDIENTSPPELKTQFPTEQEVANAFKQSFDSSREMEMLELAGVPPELLQKMQRSHFAKKTGHTILQVALRGNDERVWMDPAGYPNTSKYDLGKVLTAMANAPSASELELLRALTPIIDDVNLRNELAKSYSQFWTELEFVARREGVNANNLKTYARIASATLNTTRPSLIRGDKRWHALWAKNDEAFNKRDGTVIQDYIDGEIERNQQVYKDRGYLQLVVRQRGNTAEGWAVRQVFDSKSGRMLQVLRLSTINGEVNFKGQKFSVEQLKRAGFEISNDGAKRAFAAVVRGNHVEVTFDRETRIELDKINVRGQKIIDRKAFSEAPGSSVKVRACHAAFQ